ncbi:hypothetical protein [Enterobacter kobei]|uniref:hypothetical protein n=1 Tax=Enterobacter kobei TaxID=208224 RepID=UPI003B841956
MSVKRYQPAPFTERVLHASDDGEYVKHEDYAALEARCAALAAENAGLKAACERVSMWNEFPQATLRSTGEVVPYVVAYGSNGERDYMRNIATTALKETPATDAFLAEVRAQGVDELAELYLTLARHEANRSISESWRESARFAKDHSAQLRKGVQS